MLPGQAFDPELFLSLSAASTPFDLPSLSPSTLTSDPSFSYNESPMFNESALPTDLLIDYSSLFGTVMPSIPATTATPLVGTKKVAIALDAPIQPRKYVSNSATSKKRKTVPAQRALDKRTKTTPSLMTASIADEELPPDLIDAVERKRLGNTLSARKSRLRKAEAVATLTATNVALQAENDALRLRVQQLESKLYIR